MHKPGKTSLVLVRHGETEWNLSGKMQGHQNSDLTPKGIEQAHQTGLALKGLNIEIIYSSDLGRAIQTA